MHRWGHVGAALLAYAPVGAAVTAAGDPGLAVLEAVVAVTASTGPRRRRVPAAGPPRTHPHCVVRRPAVPCSQVGWAPFSGPSAVDRSRSRRSSAPRWGSRAPRTSCGRGHADRCPSVLPRLPVAPVPRADAVAERASERVAVRGRRRSHRGLAGPPLGTVAVRTPRRPERLSILAGYYRDV
jgi:hypothetical protein